jgi:hypothetical protein
MTDIVDLPKMSPLPAGRHDDGVGAEAADLHRPHVLRDDADAGAVVNDRPQKFPELVLVDHPQRLLPPGLFVERVEQLLPRRPRPRRRCA